MATKTSGASPDKRRKYDEAFKAEALRLASGSQYTATRFKDLLACHGAMQRMSRRGNCYDNAQVESFVAGRAGKTTEYKPG